MEQDKAFYVGVDVRGQARQCDCRRRPRRGSSVFGEIEATPAAADRFVRKLKGNHPRLHFCYEADWLRALPPARPAEVGVQKGQRAAVGCLECR
jgi:hypothetical protein